MQVSNDIHYSSDAYLISKKKYDAEHKTDSQAKESQVDISSAKLEEKIYAKSINAAKSLQPVENQNRDSVKVNNSSVEKALSTYNDIENSASTRSQSSLDQVKQMV